MAERATVEQVALLHERARELLLLARDLGPCYQEGCSCVSRRLFGAHREVVGAIEDLMRWTVHRPAVDVRGGQEG